VPARRKFLKTPVTEAGHILRWLERIALARPDVHLTLERDGRPVLQLPPTARLRERVVAVLPPSIGDRLIPVEAESGGARLVGFASPSDVTRGGTGDIYLYVNARPVRDRLLLQAVRDAYRDALPPGRHPAAVLFLQVEPEEVDVNVHPAKWEVRFRDPRTVHALVRGALTQVAGSRPALYAGRGTEAAPLAKDGGLAPPPDLLLDRGPRSLTPLGATEQGGPSESGEETARPGRPPVRFSSLRYVGPALGTYLLFEREGGLVVLDQHAAHERVLYERLREAWFGGKVERQGLLLPAWVELTRSGADALLARADELARAGFEIESAEGGVRGGIRVGLRTVPAVVAGRPPREGWTTLLEETAAALREPELAEGRAGLEAGVHAALATAACHSAFRKGDRIDPREVQALLEALDEAIWYPTCPHGRPLLALLDEGEIARRFLRR
jgi:DNA mismatch repair protein MutL